MTDDRLPVFLAQMRGAAKDVLEHISGMSSEQFLVDRKTQDAAVMALIRLGEAANRVAVRVPSFVQDHPDWPWAQMRAFRNRGAHAYETIVFEVVWQTITESIPPLLDQLNALGDPNPHAGS